MKKLLLIIIVVFSCTNIYTQKEGSLTIENIETPNSPAFMLLDKAPSSIERPNSTKAFALSLINSLENNTELPKNYAVEFTPFWFFKNKEMTALKYLGYDKNYNQNYFNGLKMFSISMAFINTPDSITNQEISNISIGIRANIISIRHKEDSKFVKKEYDKAVKNLKAINEGMPILDLEAEDQQKAKKEYDQKLQEYLNALDNIDSISKLSEIQNKRLLFALDGAIAYNSFFTENDFSSNRFGRFGAWLTANYSYKNNENTYLNIYATGRYLRDGTAIVNDEYIRQDFYDVGGKLEFEYKKLSLSYEYLYRIADSEDTYRSNGVLKYKINDKISLTGSFGKNFGDNDNLISLLGINWGFLTGEEKTVLK